MCWLVSIRAATAPPPACAPICRTPGRWGPDYQLPAPNPHLPEPVRHWPFNQTTCRITWDERRCMEWWWYTWYTLIDELNLGVDGCRYHAKCVDNATRLGASLMLRGKKRPYYDGEFLGSLKGAIEGEVYVLSRDETTALIWMPLLKAVPTAPLQYICDRPGHR